MRSRLRGFTTLLTALLLVSCATQPPPQADVEILPSDDSVFPAPQGLRPQIAFWEKVYAEWSRGQVALHDNRYMDVIYAVLELPGVISDGQSPEQKAFVKVQESDVQDTLRRVERKVATGDALSASEQAVATQLQNSSGGAGAITGASERLRSQRGMRERFKRGLEISGRYDAAFRRLFRAQGLPEDLAFLPHVESSFQNHAASSVGAVGMWQFMPDTAKGLMMFNAAVDERRDPVASSEGAARYLGSAYKRLKYWPFAITSYNHGVGGMKRAQKQFGDDIAQVVRSYSGTAFGFASRNFYTEFLAAREIARNPQHFFPEGVNYEQPLSLDRVRLRKSAPVSLVANAYGVNVSALNELNTAWNPPAQQGRIPLPAGALVWLPAGSVERLARRGQAGGLALAETVSTSRGSDQTRRRDVE